MRRNVTANLGLTVTGEVDMLLAVAVANAPGLTVNDDLVVTLNGAPVEVRELTDAHGSRLHRLVAQPGELEIRYRATTDGRADPDHATELEQVHYLRPSRYAQSDALAPTAIAEFYGLEGEELLAAVTTWVAIRLAYVAGSSAVTDGAIDTLLARRGVCRDYAHLTIALLRAMDVPARLVSVYAPGLAPMDFHAVTEAYIGGRWLLTDPTHLAPRESMLRIASGRDAADTAFLTIFRGEAELREIEVSAVVDTFPYENYSAVVQLG